MTATPLYFGGARYMTLAYLFMGATVVIFPAPYEPDELARAVNEKRITALFLVPTLLRRLLELPRPATPLFPRVRLLIVVGVEPLSAERRRIMSELCASFFNFYSSTEGGGISVLRPGASGRGVAVGRPGGVRRRGADRRRKPRCRRASAPWA